VRELLRDRFSENLSLAEVAAAVNISADHLARSFRRCHGCTMGEYVRRLRVDFACRRLAASEVPLVELALDAGFTDQSHFTKTFKRHMGVTPAVFRNLHRRRMSCTKE
jgi:AraC family transcriptional regulator